MKCNKVKNPCKICFQSVTKKNGLQCQGACLKWAHFKCLNYTPGKIQDIKAGIIKVTCPCPDCNTAVPKEILVEPPFTCTNTQCPANKLPFCDSVDCPSNIGSPIPTYPPPPFEYSPVPSLPRCAPPPRSPPFSPPRSPSFSPPRSPPRRPPRSPPRRLPRSPPRPPPRSVPCSKKCSSPKRAQSPPQTKSPPCPSSPPKRSCPSPCLPVCTPNCTSSQKVVKKLCSPKQSQSCSDLSKESNLSAKQCDKMRTISSDSKLPTAGIDQKILFTSIKNLCNTVGQLSNELRDLMCKIQANYGP